MERVLFVEDVPGDAESAANTLRSGTAYEIRVITGVDEAWATIAREPFDLIVRRIESGVTCTLIPKIRSETRFNSLPVLVLASSADPVQILRKLEKGADGVLFVDSSSQQLIERVHRAIRFPPRSAATEFSISPVVRTRRLQWSTDAARVAAIIEAVFEEFSRLNDRISGEFFSRSQAETSARKMRERFELAVRGSGDGIWDWDVVTNEVYFSPRWKAMLGYQDHELRNSFDEWQCRLHPDDRDRAQATISGYFDGTIPTYELEHRLRHKNGEYRWILSRAVAIRDADGRPIRLSGSHTDMSDRRRVEDELRSAKNEAENFSRVLDSILTNLADGVVVADENGRFLHFNDAAEEIIGLGAVDAGVDAWPKHYGLFRDEQSTAYEPAELPLARTMRGESVQEQEIFIRNPNRPKGVWISVNGRPIRDEAGAIRGGVVVFRDVTEQKAAAKDLIKAKEGAEAANRAKSDFLANMSHEIRTPMNAVIGMTELVLDTELTDEQRDYLSTVKRSAEALLDIINDILDFSKIEAGRLELDFVPFSLRDVVEETLGTLSARAWQKGLELVGRTARDVPDRFDGDAGRLRQILVNLVGNALKFTDRGSVSVEVNRDESADWEGMQGIRLTVRDTGIGIPPEKIKTIFEAFSQADTSITRRFGGTGLGLTICTRLVDLMGGRIWAESKVGEGSTFHVVISLALSTEGATPVSRLSSMRKLESARVLVVDDNELNRRLLQDLLQSWGMSPQLAANAHEARDHIAAAAATGEPYTYVLLDAHMPETDGWTLARELRACSMTTHSAVFVLTSGARPGDAELARELKIVGIISKPIRRSELSAAMLRVLDEPAAVTPAETTGGAAIAKTETPRRILLAEDNPVNQRLALALLGKWGHLVVTADNGRSAIDRWAADRFDLVLMDVQMPEMDGFEAVREIRRREAAEGRPRTPIVAMTAFAMKGDRERCKEAGMDGYISKPFHPEELADVVRGLGKPVATEGPPPVPNDQEVFDRTKALANVGGDEPLLQELIGLFLGEYNRWVEQIQTAVRDGRPDRLRTAAHTMKGSLGTFGAQSAYRAAGRLETLARGNTVDGATELAAELERQLTILRPFLVAATGSSDVSPGVQHHG